MSLLLLYSRIVVPESSVKWSATYSNTNAVLSDNGLTGTANGSHGAAIQLVADKIVTTGKYYFEVEHYTPTNFSGIGIGVCDGAQFANYIIPGQNDSRGASNHSNSTIYSAAAIQGYGTAWETAGTYRIGIAFDADADKFWIRVNGVWGGDPVAGTGGWTTNMAAGYAAMAWVVNETTTAKLKATEASFSYSLPTGFAAYDIAPVKLYKGNQARVNIYRGTKTDLQLYIGRQLIF